MNEWSASFGLVAFLSLCAAAPCLSADPDVFDRWDRVQGKVVTIKEIESLPDPFWNPVSSEGTVVLFALGALRVATPGEEGVNLVEGKKAVVLKPGSAKSFQGAYVSKSKGSVPVAVRRREKGWEIAVAAYLKVKIGGDLFSFIDSDGNGAFTEFGIDLMVKGDLGEWIGDREKERLEREREAKQKESAEGAGEKGQEGLAKPAEAGTLPLPDCVPVPGEVMQGKQRCLLASEFPSTLLLCPLEGRVPDHAGLHNGHLNLIRAHGGLNPAGISMKIFDAQVSHCRYMAKNGVCHAEDPSKPGYSAEGSAAGESSVCGGDQTVVEALSGMITTLYHSYEYLYPKVRSVCYGYEDKMYSCSIDADQPSGFLVYPFPGQDQVEPFGSGEDPDPYPQGANHPGGTFIRFVPPPGLNASLQSFRITDLLTGLEIKALYTDPSCIPASVGKYNYDYMLRTICLFPQEVLKSGHVYKAEVMISTGKRATRTLETTFKTR